MAGGEQDEVGRDLLKTFSKHPTQALIMLVAGLVAAWASFGAYSSIKTEIRDLGRDIERVNQLVAQDRTAQTNLSNRVDKVEERTTEKLDAMQRDLSDVKANVRGMSVGMEGVARNVEILIRQNTPAPPR